MSFDVLDTASTLVDRSFKYQPGYSESQIRTLHACSLSISILSVIGGLIGMTLWIRMDPAKRMVFRLQIFFILIIWDFFKALFYLCFNAIRLHNIQELFVVQPYEDYSFCDAWGFLVTAATFASDSIILCLTLQNALVTFCPQLTASYNRKIICFDTVGKNIISILTFRKSLFPLTNIIFEPHNKIVTINEGGIFPYRWYLAVVIYTFTFTAPSLVFINGHYQSNFACAVPQTPVWKRLLASWIIKYINLVSIVCVYTSIIFYLMFKFRQLKKEKAKVYEAKDFNVEMSTPMNTDDSNANMVNELINGTLQQELMDISAKTNEKRIKTAMRDLKSFIVYPLGYVFVWIAPTISQINNYTQLGNDSKNPDSPAASDAFGLRVLIALALPLSCTIDTLTFLIREKPWNSTTSELKKRGLFSIEDADSIIPHEYYENIHRNLIDRNTNDSPSNTYHNSNENTMNDNLGPVEGASLNNDDHVTWNLKNPFMMSNPTTPDQYRRRHSSHASSNRSNLIRTFLPSRRPSNLQNMKPPLQNLIFNDEEGGDEDEEEMDLLEFLRQGPKNLKQRNEED